MTSEWTVSRLFRPYRLGPPCNTHAGFTLIFEMSHDIRHIDAKLVLNQHLWQKEPAIHIGGIGDKSAMATIKWFQLPKAIHSLEVTAQSVPFQHSGRCFLQLQSIFVNYAWYATRC